MGIYRALTSAIEATIGLVAPTAALKYRYTQRLLTSGRDQARGYDAARVRGPNQNWAPINRSADADLRLDGPRILTRARDISRNHPYISGAIRTMVANIVGLGIIPQARVKLANGTPNVKFNSQVEEAFDLWTRDADSTNKLDFYTLQRLIMRHLIVDGEVLVHFVTPASQNGDIPLKLEVLECDMLDSSQDYGTSVRRGGVAGEGNYLKRGIEFNRAGQPVNYWVYDSHPGEAGFLGGISTSRPIPATEILHIYDRERASQTRGVSWLVPIILQMYDVSEYQDYEMIGSKLAAAFGVFIKNTLPDMFGTPPTQLAGDDVTPLQYVEPGRIERLAPGEEIQLASHNRPGNTYEAFIRTCLRGGASGLGMAYETFSHDYSNATYSSARAASLEERRIYRIAQDLINYQLNFPVWRRFLRTGIAAGKIKAQGPPGRGMAQYEAVNWIAPGWEWVDPQKDAEAADLELKLGITTRAKLAASRGGDIEENFAQLAREKQMMKDLDIYEQPDAPKAAPAMPQPPEPAADEGADDEEKPEETAAA